MRSYPRNSPQAAARLVALAMIADGHVCRSEVHAIRQTGAEQALGLPPGGLAPILQTLCEDILQGTFASKPLNSFVDDALIDALIAEVDDDALQRTVVDTVTSTVSADGHLSPSERYVLNRLLVHWSAGASVPV
jgi:uncharacterized tellurite resistance protein B-like protein